MLKFKHRDVFHKAISIRTYSTISTQGKYVGQATSQIMSCTHSSQLHGLIRKLKKEGTRFSSFEISCAIKKFGELRDYRACFTLFNDIKNQSPNHLDQNLYSHIIKLCLDQYGHNIDTDSEMLHKKRIKALQSAKKLFFEMQHQYNIEPNEYVVSALISNCSKVITKKSMRIAEHHWQRMKENHYPNVKVNNIVWNAMLTVYLKHFQLNKALDLVQTMSDILTPDHTTYLLLINGFRLNCKDIAPTITESPKKSDEYVLKNQKENMLSKEDMLTLTKKTFKDSITSLGAPTVMMFGCVIHNFAALGEVNTCLSVLYFMMGQRDHELYDTEICNDLGLNELNDTQNVPFPNAICYNLCLKSILVYSDLLLKETSAFEKPKENAYLQWKFIENTILEPMKNLEISNELFVMYKILIQLNEKKLEYMVAKISYIAANINLDEEVQKEYLSKQYQTDLIEVFDTLRGHFEAMVGTHKFKPHQQMFDQMYKMGFKLAKLSNENHALFDDMDSGRLEAFNEWLVTQM
eukprot:572851_1